MYKNVKAPVLFPASSIEESMEQGRHRIVSANGVWVVDSQGHQLVDATAGLWCVNVGHARKEIADVIRTAVRQLDYFHTFSGYTNTAQEKLGRRLIGFAPAELRHVFFGCSGSDANDTAVKILWQYNNIRKRPQKKYIISRQGAYHGTSVLAASLTGLPSFHREFDLPLEGIFHTDYPWYYRYALDGETQQEYSRRLLQSLKELIVKLGAENVAAFIGEPVLGAGGVIPPPSGYWEGVQSVCAENDILIVADEVVTGFCRTGLNFGSDSYDIQPDLMTTAKGLTSGVFPMSATFMTSEIWETLREGSKRLGSFSHGYTYSGHPVGAEIANCVLDILEKEKLAQNAKAVGAYLQSRLRETLGEHPNVGEIRGIGLLCAVQLIEHKERKTFFSSQVKLPLAVSEAAYKNGLIVRPLPSVGALAFSPPLTITTGDADMIVERFQKALNETLSK